MQDNEPTKRDAVDLAASGPSGVAPLPLSPGGQSPPPPVAPAAPSAVAWVLVRAGRGAAVAWKFVGDVARYYWSMRESLKEYLAGFAPNLMSEATRMREVRLAPYESHSLAEFDSSGWKASVPGRCVVCGEPTSNPPTDERLAIDDAARAFWLPVGTWLGGAALGLVLWNRWYLMLSLPLGVVVGYLLRSKGAVRLRLARCDEHVTRTNIPQVLVWGNTLVLRFGHKLVRKVFLYGETMATVVPQPDASHGSAPGVAATPAAAAPRTIPLADSLSPEESTIRHDLPAAFDQHEEENRG